MMKWTGERFVPWLKDAEIACEHLHRYAWVSTMVKGKDILDIACGEGYGTAMLAAQARTAVGVDVDAAAVTHASTKYQRPNLRYIEGSASAIPLEKESFDLICCFEAIEHIEDQQGLLKEASRLLRPDGLFVVSTPNKPEYQGHSGEENPFHVHELELDEFDSLLRGHFKHVVLLGQRVAADSFIWPLSNGTEETSSRFAIERADTGFEFRPGKLPVPLYYIAIASRSPLISDVKTSTLLDLSNALLGDRKAEVMQLHQSLQSKTEALEWREQQVRDCEAGKVEALAWMKEQVDQRDQSIEWLQSRAKALEEAVQSNEEALAWRASQVGYLELEKQELLQLAETRQADLLRARRELDEIHASRGWKFVLWLRSWKARLGR